MTELGDLLTNCRTTVAPSKSCMHLIRRDEASETICSSFRGNKWLAL
uniref:Uncharacterized protein n=1 Tax=Arundo donax TaxID=35708 RepID=A0A0A9EJX3_ARUDO